MTRLLFTLLILIFTTLQSQALETVKIQYQVPINFKYLNEQQISSQAEQYFNQYMKTNDQASLQKMLSAYCLLTNINKENPLYFVRVGIAYDKLKNDRYAKSYFCQGMCIEHSYPYTYSAYGDFWFERCRFRKALSNYLTANDLGYNSNYENLVKVGTCFEKLGDYSSAINFYKKALKIKPENQELLIRTQRLEERLQQNSLYNEQERRIQQ